MTIRPATEADLPAIRRIAESYGNLELWPGRPDYLDHELATGTLMVAEREEPVGFAGLLDRDGVAHIGDLFVRQDLLGQGIGSALLRAALPVGGERVTFASSDPRAVPIYRKFGLEPVAEMPYLEGDEASARRVPDPGLRLTEADRETVVALDAGASGRRREPDHAFLAAAGAEVFLFADGGGPVAYGYVRVVGLPEGTRASVGPVGGVDEVAARAGVLATVRAAAERAASVIVATFAPHPAIPLLRASGFGVVDTDTLMMSRRGILDPRRYVPDPDLG